jgi:hypothetical protein
MSKWVQYGKDWFNLEDFCHVWIETRHTKEIIKYGPLETDYTTQNVDTAFYAMGEWRHNGEEVIITQDWNSLDQLSHFLNENLEVYNGCICK